LVTDRDLGDINRIAIFIKQLSIDTAIDSTLVKRHYVLNTDYNTTDSNITIRNIFQPILMKLKTKENIQDTTIQAKFD